jgi:hypothetical protein
VANRAGPRGTGRSSRPFRWRRLVIALVVVYAGRLDTAKGLRVLMAGWDRYCARPSRPGLRLVIAGSGQLEGEVAAWAATRPSVRLTGQLSAAECAMTMSTTRSDPAVGLGRNIRPCRRRGDGPGSAACRRRPRVVHRVHHGRGRRSPVPARRPGIAGPGAGGRRRVARPIAEYGRQGRKAYEQRFDPADSVRKLAGVYQFAIANPAYVTSSIER